MSKFSPAKRIITVDVPDPDNFLMVLRVLKDHPDENVSIVLSPRPVDLRAVPYGSANFDRLLTELQQRLHEDKTQALRHLLGRVTARDVDGWVAKLEPADKAWFYVDTGFEDSEVRNDTNLYMKASALRLITFLSAHGIPRQQYSFYRNFETYTKIVPGTHHAHHKHDWSFDFDKKLMSQHARTLASVPNGQALSDQLRTDLRQCLLAHIYHKEQELREIAECLFAPLSDLILTNKNNRVEPEIYVGGPFTEVCAYTEEAKVSRVYAMGGFIHGGINLFPNQFNFLVDMDSAWRVLQAANAGHFDLTLIPTECIKQSEYDFASVPALEEQISHLSPATVTLYKQWLDSSDKACTLFDFAAAVYVTAPELYTTRKVSPSLGKDGVLKLNENPQGGIIMCWDDKKHMKEHKQLWLRELRATFSEQAPRGTLHRVDSSL